MLLLQEVRRVMQYVLCEGSEGMSQELTPELEEFVTETAEMLQDTSKEIGKWVDGTTHYGPNDVYTAEEFVDNKGPEEIIKLKIDAYNKILKAYDQYLKSTMPSGGC